MVKLFYVIQAVHKIPTSMSMCQWHHILSDIMNDMSFIFLKFLGGHKSFLGHVIHKSLLS